MVLACEVFLCRCQSPVKPSLWPSLLPGLTSVFLFSTCRDSMDFFRPSPPPSPRGCWLSVESSESPDRLLIDWTRFSKKFLNWSGASSGWTFAGTQRSLEMSPSSSSPDGAMDGMAIKDNPWKGIRSGSAEFPTSMDMRRSACRLLSSCAMSLGLSMLVRGN